jgi:hypothetical protein
MRISPRQRMDINKIAMPESDLDYKRERVGKHLDFSV